MRKAILLIVFLLVKLSLSAQLDVTMQTTDPVIPSWEAYEFAKHGKIGATLYTGTVNYSVPIYTYKDKDFEIPIGINYATNGFRVNHASGYLGHGWSLSGVGMITRQVKGIPDEGAIRVEVNSSSVKPTPIGVPADPDIRYDTFIYGLNANQTGEGTLSKITSNNSFYVAKTICNSNQSNQLVFYDTQPDIYSFNFCGYSGSFHLNTASTNKGECIVFDASGESAGMKVNIKDCGAGKDSPIKTIEIIDPRGYIYTFNAHEFTYISSGIESPSTRYPCVNSWHLSKIEAPNGRSIEFVYTPEINFSSVIDHSLYYYNYLPMFNFSNFNNGSTGYTNFDTGLIKDSKIYTTRLDAINCDNSVLISFSYADSDTREKKSRINKGTNNYFVDSIMSKKCRLSNISVLSNNLKIKSCKFEYSYFENLAFLSSVYFPDEGRYSFNYYPIVGSPVLGTTKFDHWGYYNDTIGKSDFKVADYLSQSTDEQYIETIKQDWKEPNFKAALSGSLSKITYPTGGYTELYYEPHSFVRRANNTSWINFNSTNVGGIRIQKIVNYTAANNPADSTIYKYLVHDTKNSFFNQSSGILINAPRYGLEYFVRENGPFKGWEENIMAEPPSNPKIKTEERNLTPILDKCLNDHLKQSKNNIFNQILNSLMLFETEHYINKNYREPK